MATSKNGRDQTKMMSWYEVNWYACLSVCRKNVSFTFAQASFSWCLGELDFLSSQIYHWGNWHMNVADLTCTLFGDGGKKSPNGLGKWSHACRRTLWIVHCYVGLLVAGIFLPVSWTHIEVQEFWVLLWSNRCTSPFITLFKPIPTSQRQRLPVGFQYIQNIDGMAHLRSLHHLGVLCQRPTAPAVYLKPCESWWNMGPTNLHRTFTPSNYCTALLSSQLVHINHHEPPCRQKKTKTGGHLKLWRSQNAAIRSWCWKW